MFLRLGIMNVRRQLTRSVLVILTLALAAISLTYSLSYQHITPPRIAEFLSDFTGGEIVVAPLRWAGQQVSDVTGEANYYYTRLLSSGMSWLRWFYPELYEDGLWARNGEMPSEFFSQETVQQLAQFPGILEAKVTQYLPVVLQARDDYGIVYSPLVLTPDLSRVAGDRGIMVNQAMDMPQTIHVPKPGDAVQIWLPQAGSDGSLQLDYADSVGVELPFCGLRQMKTRSVFWMGGNPPSIMMEDGQFNGALAWVDQETWANLLQQVGVGDQLPVANLALRVEDPKQLDEIIVQLGQAFPKLTFLNTGDVEDRLFSTGKMELFRQAPKTAYSVREKAGLVTPASVNRILGLLFLLIAGFLLGGHMLTNAAARHQEIGTLKALGARRRDILLLGISEAATTTFIGVTSGFLLLRLYGAYMEMRGGQPIVSVLWLMLTEYGQVLGLAMLASLVFAFFPIWRLASLAPMEVLRNE